MTTLPETTLARLQWRAESGDHDDIAILHLLARADKRDQDVAVFIDSYSSTIAALCRRLEALERGAKDPPAAPVDDSPVANALTVAEAALADVAEGESGAHRLSDRLQWTETRCTEALAAIRPVMKEHGIQTSEWPAAAPAPTPPPTAPADGLVERVANAMGPSTQAAMEAGELPFGNAYAAIREVAAWLDSQGHQASANVVRWRIDG
jgi:hypothetical protein